MWKPALAPVLLALLTTAPFSAQTAVKGPAHPSPGIARIPAAVPAQLAGEALAAFPDFEVRRTFQETELVQVAVDPLRFPQVVGLPADFYVVEARTRGEWAANRTLTDLTGAVETVVLGASVVANTVLVDAGTLAAGVGVELGRGYDVVVDLDGDGLLSDGDLVDGFGEEPGFFVVRDPSLPGPFLVTEVVYSLGSFAAQDLYYPAAIPFEDKLPVVFVSHANGASYTSYDHIGQHLASHGYIVVSHQTNTLPGVPFAAVSIINNTDLFLSEHASIASGALADHVDEERLIWLGDRRSGEAVAVAIEGLKSGTYTANRFGPEDVKLVVSMNPTDFLGPVSSTPGSTPFALISGGGDDFFGGCPGDLQESFHLHDRASGPRHSLYIQGAAGGSFGGGGVGFGVGPCATSVPETHSVLQGYLLPLLERHARNSVSAMDFLWRPWEAFRPMSAPTGPCVVVDLMYRPAPGDSLVIDDFQTQPAITVSSSGAPVATSLVELDEDRLDDPDFDYSHVAGQVMNGMTQGGSLDDTRGAALSFDDDRFLSFDLPGGATDATTYDYLSFRVCQATRHPLTTATLADLTFTVELEDASGTQIPIDTSVFGAGAEEPYQRIGCGAGTGWLNEFETVRIRLEDFRGVDLDALVRVTLRFGPSFGSSEGRLGLDEIELVRGR